MFHLLANGGRFQSRGQGGAARRRVAEEEGAGPAVRAATPAPIKGSCTRSPREPWHPPGWEASASSSASASPSSAPSRAEELPDGAVVGARCQPGVRLSRWYLVSDGSSEPAMVGGVPR